MSHEPVILTQIGQAQVAPPHCQLNLNFESGVCMRMVRFTSKNDYCRYLTGPFKCLKVLPRIQHDSYLNKTRIKM